eukprot:350341-Chlamydomonas_euryale.AAC.4
MHCGSLSAPALCLPAFRAGTYRAWWEGGHINTSVEEQKKRKSEADKVKASARAQDRHGAWPGKGGIGGPHPHEALLNPHETLLASGGATTGSVTGAAAGAAGDAKPANAPFKPVDVSGGCHGRQAK